MSRHNPNPYLNEPVRPAAELLNSDQTRLSDALCQELTSYVVQNAILLGRKYKPSGSDPSVYTESPGVALLFAKLEQAQPSPDKAYLKDAKALLEPTLRGLKGKRITFLCGDAGPLCMAAYVWKQLGDGDKAKVFADRVVALEPKLADPELPDELLYGRCGYLYGLLFLQKLGFAVPDALIEKIVEQVHVSGRNLAKATHSPCPLMYAWHDSYYMGAAHGLAGILFTLMLTPGFNPASPRGEELSACMDYLMSLQFSSGNFPSSLRSHENDKLIHWCHGAPGFVHMYLLAFKHYAKPAYMTAALACGEVIWERGLLKKGCGLCHGVAGNAYAFSALWQTTKDVKWVHRLVKFTEWIRDEHLKGFENADRPWSLFEGFSGSLYFLLDICGLNESGFPVFYLPS